MHLAKNEARPHAPLFIQRKRRFSKQNANPVTIYEYKESSLQKPPGAVAMEVHPVHASDVEQVGPANELDECSSDRSVDALIPLESRVSAVQPDQLCRELYHFFKSFGDFSRPLYHSLKKPTGYNERK